MEPKPDEARSLRGGVPSSPDAERVNRQPTGPRMPMPPTVPGRIEDVMPEPPDSGPPRKTWDPVLDWLESHDLALTLGSIVLLVVSAGAILLSATLDRGPDNTESQPLPDRPESVQGPIEYVNVGQGFGFTSPDAWEIREGERLTRIQNPSGRIVVSYRLGGSGDLEAESSRLLASLATAHPDLELIGKRRELIDGLRSLLVSGTATDGAGRSVRLLAITIQAEPRNYAISIVVPGHSDPARVLPRIEEIVSSFELR